MTTVTRSIEFAVKGRRKRAVVAPTGTTGGPQADVGVGPAGAPNDPVGRVPRIARLMALAIRFDQLLRDGVVASQSELAGMAHVTQPRMTQILNLLHLAPDIQEEILFLQPVARGRDPIHERLLRPLVAVPGWAEQRRRWRRIVTTTTLTSACGPVEPA